MLTKITLERQSSSQLGNLFNAVCADQKEMGVCSVRLLQGLILMMGSIIFGWTVTLPSPVVPLLKSEFGLTTFYESAFNAAASLGAIIGCLITGIILRYLTRRWFCCVLGVFDILFWFLLLTTTKDRFWGTIIVRALCGINMGCFSSVVPLYLGEIAPPEYKGLYGVLHSIGIAFGHVSANLLGAADNWRLIIYIIGAWCVLFSGLIWLVPESPVSIAQRMARKEKKLNNGVSSGTKQRIWQKKHMIRLWFAIGMHFFQQFAGIAAVVTNVSQMMAQVGMSWKSSYQAAIAVAAEFVATIVSALLMDKAGVKIMWCVSSFGGALFLLIYVLNVKFEWVDWLPVAALFGYLLAFGSGLGPIAWFLTPQIMHHKVRSTGNAIATACNWTCCCIMTFAFPYMLESWGQFGSMLFLCCINFAAGFYGVFAVRPYLPDEDDDDSDQTSIEDQDEKLNGDNENELNDIRGGRKRSRDSSDEKVTIDIDATSSSNSQSSAIVDDAQEI